MSNTENTTKQQNPSNVPEDKSLAVILKRLREEANMTQEQASDLFRINRSTYAYYENGKSHPKYDTLRTMVKAYGVTSDYLLGLSPVAGTAPVDQLHATEVPYDANNEQATSYLKGRINDGIAELSDVERMVLFRLRIMDKEDQRGIVNFINRLGELNKEEWETLFRLCLMDKEDQKKVLDFIKSL